ncbi:DHS-like NAD/FAD-binding domain-containing protein [Globomyces pollinis-pini]|nr:DHS-like NAD/FAD-binding domain-containing protein [Globomyces pollinis-pini]
MSLNSEKLESFLEFAQEYEQVWNTFIKRLKSSKHIIFVTGAGISVNSGIPDFRSIQNVYTDINPKMLLNIDVYSSKDKLNQYLKFVNRYKEYDNNAEPSKTHHFLKNMVEKGNVLRVYTQNIDSLHEKSGMNPKYLIKMHGDLNFVKCSSYVCGHKELYTQLVINTFEKTDNILECTCCKLNASERSINKKRKRAEIGRMVPNIVLYDDVNDCSGTSVSAAVEEDLKCSPDLLIILGTSLSLTNLNGLLKKIRNYMMDPFIVYINKKRLKENHPVCKMLNIQLIGDCDMILEAVEEELKE